MTEETTALMTLPKCPVHGCDMVYREPGTQEQRFVGAMYVCGYDGCQNSVLFPSPELRQFLRQLNNSIRQQEG